MLQSRVNLGITETPVHFGAVEMVAIHGEYNTLFIQKNARMLVRSNSGNEEFENMAMIAAYIDYLMNLEENVSNHLPDARPISRWREFGLQKGVLRI